MMKQILYLCIWCAAFATMLPAAPATNGQQPRQSQSNAALKKALADKKLNGYAETVNGLLNKAFSEASAEEIGTHLKRAAMRHALLQATFLNTCLDSEAFKKMQDSPQGRDFIFAFLSRPEWIEEFLDIAECFAPVSQKKERDFGAAFAQSHALLTAGGRQDITVPALRRLALAYGVVYRASHRIKAMERNDPKDFYNFYRKQLAEKRLHPDFADYAPYEMIYIVYFWHDLKSMEWLRENVNVPKRDMDGTCWRADYKRDNLFGYSIHGHDYYRPWEEADQPYSRMETIARIGGVCGSLSTFGAMEAIMQGVGALPIGQPGHCAYAVRIKPGKWVGGFGGPGGNNGEQPFSPHGSETDFLFLIDDIYMDAKTHSASQDILRAAQLIDRMNGSKEKRYALAERAVNVQPDNLLAWDHLLAWFPDRNPSREAAMALGRKLGDSFIKRPAVALRLAKRNAPLAAESGDKHSLPPYYEPIMRTGTDSWNAWQWKLFMNWLARDFDKPKELKLDFCRMVLRAYSKANYYPEVIAWAQEQFKNDAASRQTLLEELIAAISGGIGSSPEVQGKTIAQLIVMSSENGALEAFQQFGKNAESVYGDREKGHVKSAESWAAKVQPFPGECLSAGGLFKPTSTCGWDAPLLHPRIISPQLGFFHTESQVKAGGEVTLTRLTEPSGIVVVAASGSNSRIPPLAVSVSEDGQTWENVYRSEQYQDIYRIDLSDKPRRIRHVRVWRDDDRKEFFHLRGVLVYGRRLQ